MLVEPRVCLEFSCPRPQAAQHPETQLILTLNGEAWHLDYPQGHRKNQQLAVLGLSFFYFFFPEFIYGIFEVIFSPCGFTGGLVGLDREAFFSC